MNLRKDHYCIMFFSVSKKDFVFNNIKFLLSLNYSQNSRLQIFISQLSYKVKL